MKVHDQWGQVSILTLCERLQSHFASPMGNRLCSGNVSGYPSQTDRIRGTGFPSFSLWIGMAVVVGTALRLFQLGTKSFWLDEAISAVLARVDRHVFVDAIIHRQANMALYYVLLRGWIRLGGSEFVIRGLSVVAGVSTIPAIYFLGTRLFGRKAGRVAALLLSVHAFHIEYSQEARAYSWSMLLAVVSSLFFLWCLERPSPRNWGAYIVASTLMVYAQVFGGWMLLAQWVSLLSWRSEVRWKQFFFSAAMICFLVSPLAYCLLLVSDRSQLYWVTKPTLQGLYKFCLDMTGDGGPLLLLAYLTLVVGGVGAGISRPRTHPDSTDVWKYWFLVTWFILPVAVVLAISLRWPAFVPRFLILCLPPLVLLVADALTRLRSKVLFSAALMILLGLSLRGTYSYYRVRTDADHTDNWRDATRYVLSHAEVGDAVLFSYSEERLAFDEYRSLFQTTDSPIHEFPEQTELELLTRRPSRPSVELLNGIVSGYKRVWVISAFQPNRASRPADAMLRAHFSDNGGRNFGFVHADLFSGRTTPPPDQ
jgi:mannosyltransferase